MSSLLRIIFISNFLRPPDRINQNHTLCWRRHVSNFVTSSWKHMFMLSLSVFSKSLYISTKSRFNHLNNMKKFRYGQPMKHTSGKQMLHLLWGDIKLSLLRVDKFCEASFCRVEDCLLDVLKDKNVDHC